MIIHTKAVFEFYIFQPIQGSEFAVWIWVSEIYIFSVGFVWIFKINIQVEHSCLSVKPELSIFRGLDVLLKVLLLNNFIIIPAFSRNDVDSVHRYISLSFFQSSGKKSRQTGGGERSKERPGDVDKAGSSKSGQSKFRIPKDRPREERKH